MTAEQEEAWDRLLFHLENETGFWFGLVVGEDAGRRAELREKTEGWCNERGHIFSLHSPGPDDVAGLAISLVKLDASGVHWIRVDGPEGVAEEWSTAAAGLLMAMNERREAYRKSFNGGIIVEGRTSLKRILREMAPDLFSIRALIAEPGGDLPRATSDFPEWQPPMMSKLRSADLDPDLLLTSLSQLEMLGDAVSAESRVGAKTRAMWSLFRSGRREEAGQHARELLSMVQQDAIKDSAQLGRCSRFAYVVLAEEAVRTGNAREGLRLFDQSISSAAVGKKRKARTDPWDCYLRAAICREIGDSDAERAELESLLRLFPFSGGTVPQKILDRRPAFHRILLDSHLRLAEILASQNELLKAKKNAKKVLVLAESLVALRPEDVSWQLERFRGLIALGHIQVFQNKVAVALNTLTMAADLAEQMDSSVFDDKRWRSQLERCYALVALLLAREKHYSQKSDRLRKRALATMKKHAEREPSDAEYAYGLAVLHLMRVKLLETKDPHGAKESAQEALDLIARLPVETPDQAAIKAQVEALRAFAGPTKKRSLKA